ncbi:hypothetical protein WDZ17_15100 [Pseudokineococcus basanitobsidens]|uniref:Uncharacterized protein n=1 Tax=Pseudokineococcus basanitobsidens TaxID=1926649 RepID=A0ABU8RNT1_9ACTN
MSSSDLSTPLAPSGVVPPPAQVRPRHDDLVDGGLGRGPLAPVHAAGRADDGDTGRGTPLQALAGWGAALVVGAACWAGALAVVTRLV